MKNSNALLPLSTAHLQNQQPKYPIIFSLKRAWQCLRKSFIGSDKLRIWQTYDHIRNNWWHAYDPRTGRHTSVDSEAKILAWIEKHFP